MTASWETVTLGEVAVIERSGVAPEAIKDNTNYLGLEHVASGGAIEGPQVVLRGDLVSQKYRFDEGHILYGKLRPYLGKIATPEFSGVCSTDILPIRPGPRVDKRFLFHLLRQPKEVDRVSGLATGANLPRISANVLQDLEILIPAVEEQRRIASVLDLIDDLRAKRRQARGKYDTLTQAIFADMFGTPQANIYGLEETALGNLVQVKGGKRLPKGSKYAESPTPHPYIRVVDIRGGIIDRSDIQYLTPETQAKVGRYTVAAGDVIISIAGSIGQIASVPEYLHGANLTENAAKLVRVDTAALTTEYLASFLRSSFAQNQIAARTGQVTIGKLALFRIASLRILVPPIKMQTRYEEIVRQVRQGSNGLSDSRIRMDALFASLQQKAFRGDL